ncbi:MarR family transcriptional regulator [Nocardia sp. SYP-A9097]|uniref:MarR family winged helix-turn-helix transcriptional regulator n=1 Tax=Nocardia sp. SYP-A9097 TaxID=2663237 RepID=UPI00129A93EC|nr:MarR family transcriptional regulator [Nocardia sp. SYP-A9097]MRH91354.1 MarR family transcriptional regulator [Nocardia sp. SYP-A9097]
MEKPTDRVEFETMLLGRYTINARYRRDGTRMDRSAYVLLSRLSVQGPMTIGQLTDAFGLDTSTLNRQTAALLRTGVVERIPDPDGGIARKFRITAAGERGLEAERAANTEGLQRVMSTWSAADVATFAEYLERLNTDIERIDGRPWPRP